MKHPTQDQILRRVRFTPYLKGKGPTFALTLWDASKRHNDRDLLGYRLTMHEPGKAPRVLFADADFGASPCHAIEADETVEELMDFLTLRPGDTDPEYFADYTDEQKRYCELYAESLACEVAARFEKEET